MIKQISIFTENRKGAMRDITETVSNAGIDIYNVVTNDSAEYGIARMLLTDPDKGLELLRSKGYMCKIDKVIGVQIPDDVGSLTKLLTDTEGNFCGGETESTEDQSIGTISCDGLMIGSPSAGFSRFLEASIRERASATALSESGT